MGVKSLFLTGRLVDWKTGRLITLVSYTLQPTTENFSSKKEGFLKLMPKYIKESCISILYYLFTQIIRINRKEHVKNEH